MWTVCLESGQWCSVLRVSMFRVACSVCVGHEGLPPSKARTRQSLHSATRPHNLVDNVSQKPYPKRNGTQRSRTLEKDVYENKYWIVASLDGLRWSGAGCSIRST